MDIGENLRFNRTIQWQLLRQTFAIHLVARRQLPGSTATGRNEPLLGDRHECEGGGAKVLVVALDCRSSPLPSEPPPNLRSPRQSVS